MQTRDKFIDIAKLFGIFMVVFGHITKNNNIHIFLYTFHMPLFFVLSGMTFYYTERHNYSIKDFLRKKFKTIMIPYFFFLVISFIYWILIEKNARQNQNNDIIGNVVNIVICVAKSEWYESNIVMWFLPCLFSTETIYFFIKKYIKNQLLDFIIIIIFGVIGFILCYNKVFLPLCIETAFIALMFIHIGYLCNKKGIFQLTNNSISFVVFFILTFLLIITIKYNGKVGMLAHEYGNPFLFLLGAYSGSFLVLIISVYFSRISHVLVNNIEYIGKSSIVVMACHEPIKRVLIKIFSMITKNEIIVIRESLVYTLIITIITITITIIAGKIIKKYLPQVIGQIKNTEETN